MTGLEEALEIHRRAGGVPWNAAMRLDEYRLQAENGNKGNRAGLIAFDFQSLHASCVLRQGSPDACEAMDEEFCRLRTKIL